MSLRVSFELPELGALLAAAALNVSLDGEALLEWIMVVAAVCVLGVAQVRQCRKATT